MTILDVSVVIPCYNAAETLKRSLDSVANQLARPREIVVVDDGSDSPIEPLVANFECDTKIPIRVLTQPNRGASAARNAGIKAARSRYIAFLDADDIWLPEKLKIQYDVMESEGLTISGHGYAFHANQLPKSPADINLGQALLKRLSKWRFSYGNPFFTPTVMVSKDEFAGFDERFRRVDDYKAWLESFRPGRCGYIGIVLAAGFKPPIGHSGLTGSIDRMHESYLEVLKTLFDERRIDLAFYTVARLFEALKFPVRRRRANAAIIT